MTDGSSIFLDLVATPLLWLSDDGTVARGLNAAALRLFAADRPPIAVSDLFGEAAATVIRARLPATPGQRLRPFDLDAETPAGPLRLRLSIDAAPELGPGWLVGVEDRSPSRRDGSADEAWRAMLLQVLDELPVGLELYDDDFVELFSNRETLEMFGYTTAEVPSLGVWWEIGFPDPAYRAKVQEAWWAAVAQSRRTQNDVLLRDLAVACKDGSRKIVRPRYRAIGDHHVVVYWDLTVRRRLEQQLRRAAETDALTGVCDRRRFFAEAAAMLAESAASGRPLSLLMLDVDHFKSINDRFGHAAGDEVLRAVARRLVDAVRPQDLVARLGGEEFAVLLPGIDGPAAATIAERARRALSRWPVALDDGQLTVQASVGCTTRLAGDERVDQLLERADRALYGAKRDGRDRVHFMDGAP